MEYFVLFMFWLQSMVWGIIFFIIGDYLAAYFHFAWTLYNHPENGVCCCGAHIDDHSLFDNHAIKTQREWFIECNTPKFM